MSSKKPIAVVVFLICVLFSFLAFAEQFHPNAEASWKGRVYTPSSFPRGTWCGLRNGHETNACPMCTSLRRQWRAWTVAYNAKVNQANKEIDDRLSQIVNEVIQENDEYEIRYRNEVREVKVTKTRMVKRCFLESGYGIFGMQTRQVCRMVPEKYTTTEKRTVRVPYRVKKSKAPPKPIPERPPIELKIETKAAPLLPTPVGAIRRLMGHLRPRKTDIIIDAGSGDGRLLIEASGTGARAIGVEIDGNLVELSRQRIRAAGSTAIVFQGDATTFDYSEANIVYIYQYPDLMKRIVSRLRRGTQVVSYMHPIPNVHSVKYSAGDGQVFYIGTVGGVEQSKQLTFGL